MEIKVERTAKDSFSGNVSVTVENLIEILQKFPPNLPVRTEGCDCYGEIWSVELDKEVVYLHR